MGPTPALAAARARRRALTVAPAYAPFVPGTGTLMYCDTPTWKLRMPLLSTNSVDSSTSKKGNGIASGSAVKLSSLAYMRASPFRGPKGTKTGAARAAPQAAAAAAKSRSIDLQGRAGGGG